MDALDNLDIEKERDAYFDKSNKGSVVVKLVIRQRLR